MESIHDVIIYDRHKWVMNPAEPRAGTHVVNDVRGAASKNSEKIVRRVHCLAQMNWVSSAREEPMILSNRRVSGSFPSNSRRRDVILDVNILMHGIVSRYTRRIREPVEEIIEDVSS